MNQKELVLLAAEIMQDHPQMTLSAALGAAAQMLPELDMNPDSRYRLTQVTWFDEMGRPIKGESYGNR